MAKYATKPNRKLYEKDLHVMLCDHRDVSTVSATVVELFYLMVCQSPRGPQRHQYAQEPQHVYLGKNK